MTNTGNARINYTKAPKAPAAPQSGGSVQLLAGQTIYLTGPLAGTVRTERVAAINYRKR